LPKLGKRGSDVLNSFSKRLRSEVLAIADRASENTHPVTLVPRQITMEPTNSSLNVFGNSKMIQRRLRLTA
jgi:hypothetical protein